MKSARYFVASLATLFFLSLLAWPQTGDFTIIVMPDVQNESDYHPNVLQAQTQWIVNSQASLNIQMVLGEGDIVNNGSDNEQWTNADAAYRLLDNANIPYLLAIGNHDYDNFNASARTATGYNQWFGATRYSGRPWYAGSYNNSNENFYGTWTINGKTYLFLILEYVPRDQAVQWAQNVLTANPDKEVIVVTHSFMYSDGTRVDQCDTSNLNSDNYGDKLWAKLISQYGNISMVLSGHITSGHASRRRDEGINSNLVNQVFSNFQTLPNGGNGWLRIMTFHSATDTIDVKTYSPYLNIYMTDTTNQFTIPWHAPTTSATTGTISGLVRDAGTCSDIAGVTVTAGGKTATTDANGRYSITLPGGFYAVNATANDYKAGSSSASVHNSYAADTNFYLTAAIPPDCTLSTVSPSVTICTPQSNATVTSPVPVKAGTTDSNSVTYVQLYVDGAKVITQNGGVLNTNATMTAGTHRVTVQAKDSTGATFKTTINITVSGP